MDPGPAPLPIQVWLVPEGYQAWWGAEVEGDTVRMKAALGLFLVVGGSLNPEAFDQTSPPRSYERGTASTLVHLLPFLALPQ